MSLLPTAVDTQLSAKDVEAARNAILAASVKIQPTVGFSAVPLPPRLTDEQKAVFHAAQKEYENMEWAELHFSASTIKNMRIKVPKEVDSRLLLCRMMMATEADFSASYHDAVKHLKLDVLNGDLYTCLALLKLGEYDVIGCASLLSLAELCPSYHPDCFRLAQDKLRITKSTVAMQVFKVHKNVRTPEDVQWFKERYPEIKASSNAVDDAVREWHSASPLERFRLVLTWIRTPYLSAMAVDDVQIDVKTLKSDSMLLKLPDQAFAKIMEYAGKRSMLSIAETSVLGFQRVDYSPAWLYFASVAFGVTIQEMLDSGARFDQWRWILQQLPVLKSLEHANWWDLSTFDYLMSQTRVLIEEPGSVQACTMPINHTIYLLLMAISPPSVPIFAAQWLISNSNLHLSLARLSLSADQHCSNYCLSFLGPLLNYPCADASKWVQELIEAGFHHSLLARAGKAPSSLEATKLLALLKLHHFQRASPTDRNFGNDLILLGSDDIAEQKEEVLAKLAGVYHVAGYHIRDWEETTMAPFFASFQVDARDLSLTIGTDDLDDDAIEDDEPPLPEDLSEESFLLKVKGHGRYIDENGEISLVELKANVHGSYAGLALQATLGGKARMSLVGSLIDPFFGGDVAFWDDDATSDEYVPTTPGGAFLLWKSSLPDTEANWNDVHVRDIDALRKLRTAGGYEYERKEAILARETLVLPPVAALTRPSDQEARRTFIINKFTFDALAYLAIHSDVYERVRGCAQECGAFKPEIGASSLPRRPYETEELHELRAAIYHRIHEEQHPLRYQMICVLRVENGLGDLITLCTAMRRLCWVLEQESDQADAPDIERRKFLDAVASYVPCDRNADIGGYNAIEGFDNAIAYFTQLRERYSTTFMPEEERVLPSHLSIVGWTLSFLQLVLEDKMLARLKNPVEHAATEDLVLKFLLEEDSAHASTTESEPSAAAANESSSLCKAVITECERLDSQSDFAKLIRKWSFIFGTTHLAIDPLSESFIPLLIVSLCHALMPSAEAAESASLIGDDSEHSSDYEEDEDNLSSFASKVSSFSLSPTAIIAIGTAVATIGLGAFALGRWLNNKP